MSRARKSVLDMIKKNGIGAEIGVFKGRFSRMILNRAKPVKLFLIDPWENFEDPSLEKARYSAVSGHDMEKHYQTVLDAFQPEIEKGQVEVLRGKAEDVADLMPDGSLDYVYIDGDHRYEGVKIDLEIAWRKTAPQSIIVLDDHHLNGWWGDGVVRATNEFIAEHPDEVHVAQCVEGQMVLRRISAEDSETADKTKAA